MKFLALITENYIYVAAFALTVSIGIYLIHLGWRWHENADLRATAKQERVLNEIRNRPHSVAITAARLLNGSF